ncbi:hypothetical protein OEJ84_23730 (plasmid) [Bacillus subtilis]|uniref:Uncharacterized protein n=1 Tax=Bacillus phage vB_BsuS_PJN02 TaxID=2920374 RepID=A0AC61TS68_9CAUD|nr:hypothetical protein [Bacillus subtilis]YP_010681805.1 hypothetical protein PQE76_gp187 [Bacillus phage vB_BsuS_PJN02]UNH58530.1 hypothetical protein [Bacillus phage vB_BsuS_PJN02]WOF32913.1 hypothetical protein OEJ84_23730 [Bacillus subtilis]
MDIRDYMGQLNIENKCFIMLTVTPKGRFPRNADIHLRDAFIKSIFPTEDKYIGIYDESRKEILQEVYFMMEIMPFITDEHNRATKQKFEPRATRKDIDSYFAVKKFYDKVPYSEMNEEEALEAGLKDADAFCSKYPIEDHDIKIVLGEKHSGCEFLGDMTFKESDDGYYFEYFHCIN